MLEKTRWTETKKSADLKRRLAAAAVANGRTMEAEMIRRLEASLEPRHTAVEPMRIYLDPPMIKAAIEKAKRSGRSMADHIAHLIAEDLANGDGFVRKAPVRHPGEGEDVATLRERVLDALAAPIGRSRARSA